MRMTGWKGREKKEERIFLFITISIEPSIILVSPSHWGIRKLYIQSCLSHMFTKGRNMSAKVTILSMALSRTPIEILVIPLWPITLPWPLLPLRIIDEAHLNPSWSCQRSLRIHKPASLFLSHGILLVFCARAGLITAWHGAISAPTAWSPSPSSSSPSIHRHVYVLYCMFTPRSLTREWTSYGKHHIPTCASIVSFAFHVHFWLKTLNTY